MSRLGLLILNSAVAMCSPKEPVFGPSFLRKGKTFSFDDGNGLVAGQLAPVRPAQFLIGKERLKFLAALLRGALGILLALVELLEKKQE